MSTENQPTAPASLPKYLREGLPKQNRENLTLAHEYIEELIEWSQRPVDEDDLPDETDPADDDEDEGKGGTIVLEKVTCGDETCKCMREGKKHGPYRKRYYRKPDGTLTSEYLGKP